MTVGLHNPNILLRAYGTAYTECDDWLEQVNIYLEGNYNFLAKYLQKHMPEFEVIPSEGTYMAWIKTSKLGISPKALEQFFIEKAKVSVYMGGSVWKAYRGIYSCEYCNFQRVSGESFAQSESSL